MEISKKEKGIRTESEGINQLSDDIFHYVFSFLEVFDAVGLSSVSERWKDLCYTMPYLDFDIRKFCIKRNLVVGYSLIENFKDFINWVLISPSSTRIIIFQLSCEDIFTQQQIFRWICAAARRNVQEAILSFDPSESFELPFSLVTCDSLRVLKLHLFGRALQLPRYSGFCRLKCLELKHLQLFDEDLARNLFSGCPLLENLCLRDCILGDVNVLDISSYSIKHVSVEDGMHGYGYNKCAVKISCPNLLSFKYTAPIPRCYLLDNLSLVENICFDPDFQHETMTTEELGHFTCGILKVVHNITALKLGMGFVTALYDVHNELTCSLCMFRELKHLNLWLRIDKVCMHVMMQLLKHSPNLESLNLYCDEMHESSEIFEFKDCSRITCIISHLKYVRLISFNEDENEIEFVRFLLENGLVLEELMIICPRAVNIVEITEIVMNFTRSSPFVIVKVLRSERGIFDLWDSL